jgi:hypothetical protein
MGDRAANICERVFYIITGERYGEIFMMPEFSSTATWWLNGIRAREEGLALIQRRERRKYFLPELWFLRCDLLLAQETVPWLY